MPDIDTSSYPTFKQSSPFEMVGHIANLQNTLNQNKLFQQQFNTNLAASEGMKAAIDPNTGEYDPQKLRAWIASNPNAGYGLGQIIQQSQEAQGRNIANKNAQYDYQQKQLKTLAGYTSRLMKPGATGDDAIGVFAEALVNGAITPQQFVKAQSELPRIPGTDKIDNSRIPKWAESETTKFMAEHDRLNYYNPAPTQVDTPQGTRFERIPQAMGSTPTDAGGFIPAIPAPTTQKYNPATQQNEYVGVLPNGGQGGGGAPQPAGAGGQPPAAGGGNAFAPGTPAAPPLGMPEAKSADAAISVNLGNELTKRADAANNNKAVLGNMESELGNINTGPGTESVAKFEKFLNANVFPKGFQYNVEGLSDREKFNKLAGLYIQTQFQNLGGTGTDSKLDAAGLTSPNSELSKLGIKGLIALAKGNEDAIQAKGREWAKYAQSGGLQNYRQFSTEFNKHFDPRVFQAQYLGKADQKKMLSGMTQQEKNQLHQSALFARQNGWIQ